MKKDSKPINSFKSNLMQMSVRLAELSSNPFVKAVVSAVVEEYREDIRKYIKSLSMLSDPKKLVSIVQFLIYDFPLLQVKHLAKMSARILYLLPKIPHLLKTDQSQTPPSPPLLGKFLLKASVPRDRRDNAIGDAEGEFAVNWKEFGKWPTYFLYWEQIGIECFTAVWRVVRWLVLHGVLRHLTDVFHKFVG